MDDTSNTAFVIGVSETWHLPFHREAHSKTGRRSAFGKSETQPFAHTGVCSCRTQWDGDSICWAIHWRCNVTTEVTKACLQTRWVRFLLSQEAMALPTVVAKMCPLSQDMNEHKMVLGVRARLQWKTTTWCIASIPISQSVWHSLLLGNGKKGRMHAG